MRLKSFAATGFVAAVAALGTITPAQEEMNGPTALIITYRAEPGQRARFRAVMQTEGLKQLERWKESGVFAGYQALFTSYAGNNVPDMFVTITFHHFTDLGRWQKIEETNPGGLPAAAQSLGSPTSTSTADIVSESASAPPTRDSQFLVLEYDVLVDMPKYKDYLLGYATPQFDEWEKAGVLSSYVAYVNQNPAGAPWSSLIVLEYKDLKSLAAREVVKNKVRAVLAASNPVWKKWSEDKTAIRNEKAAIPARALNLP